MKRFIVSALAIGGAITATIGALGISWTAGEHIRANRRERDRLQRIADALQESNRQMLLGLEALDRGE